MSRSQSKQLAIDGLANVYGLTSEPITMAIEGDVVIGTQGESRQPHAFAEEANQSSAVEDVYEECYAGILPLLQRLDERLALAVNAADRMFAARAAGDLYRGLAISPSDVTAAFNRVPGEPFLSLRIQTHETAETSNSLTLRRLLWLRDVYGLSDLDLDIILIGLAPEIDLRYERLYAYLQDDVTKRKPGIDLALNLLCASAGEKLQQRKRFAPDAPLLHHRLIEIFVDPHHPNSPLLARFFRLDDQIVRFLLLDDGVDARLTKFCRLCKAAPPQVNAPLAEGVRQQLHALAAQQRAIGLRLYFQGPMHCGQDEAVRLLASSLSPSVLEADLYSIFTANQQCSPEIMQVLVREAWLHGAILRIQVRDGQGENVLEGGLDALWCALDAIPVDCVIECASAWVPGPRKPLGVLTIPFTYPEAAQRQAWWRHCLTQQQIDIDESFIADLALRYRMTYAQIRDAAAVGAIKSGMVNQLGTEDADRAGENITRVIFAAARAQCGHELAALATKIEPRATWEDLILPEDETAQLHEICARFNYRDQVFNDWGFAQKISYGRGISALFSGGSGTGKTMAAEVIANALELDIYRIDLAQVVSKYIGETEKNLDRVFTAATNANAILFFDEADALFGKRTEVKDSHDRYANLEVSYLLQKMEQYEGIAILATNLADNLDQAFTRRLAFSIHFPFPDEIQRQQIWMHAWPEGAPVQKDMDFCLIAKELKMSGGNIRNVGLSASFLAVTEGVAVSTKHVLNAAWREYAKLGVTMPDVNFGKLSEESPHRGGAKKNKA